MINGLVIVIPLIILSGAGILWIIRPPRAGATWKASLVETAALSFGVGAGSIPLILFYLNLLGLTIDLKLLLGILIPLSFIGMLSFLLTPDKGFKPLVRMKSVLKASYPPETQGALTTPVGRTGYSRGDLIMIILLFVIVILTSIKALSTPMHYFDDRATWSYKAKVIFNEGSVKGESFFDPTRLNIARKYPLALPILEACVHLAMGRFDDRLVKIIFPIFLCATILILFQSQLSFSQRSHALFFTLLYAALPFLSLSMIEEGGSADTGYADIPLSFFYAVSVFYLYHWMKKGEGLLISSLFMAFALFEKQEGIILFAGWAAALIAILFIASDKGFKPPVYMRKERGTRACPARDAPRWRAVLPLLLPPVILNIPFLIYAWNIPTVAVDYPGNLTLKVMLENIGRLPPILLNIAGAFFSFRWGFLGAPFLAAILMYPKKVLSVEYLFLLWMIFFPLFCYIILLVVTPADASWQLRVALDRLLTHFAPIIIFFISRIYGDIIEKRKLKVNFLECAGSTAP